MLMGEMSFCFFCLEEIGCPSISVIPKLTPIQMPHIDIEEVREGRKAFTQEEWMDVMLRSCGYEPEQLNNREKWLLLARMLPLVENNFNLCELGPRSTGKSHRPTKPTVLRPIL